jgi:hypothetical protein
MPAHNANAFICLLSRRGGSVRPASMLLVAAEPKGAGVITRSPRRRGPQRAQVGVVATEGICFFLGLR